MTHQAPYRKAEGVAVDDVEDDDGDTVVRGSD